MGNDVVVGTKGGPHSFEVALFTGDLLEARQIGQHGLIGHLFGQIFVALDDAIEPVKHGDSLLLYVYRRQREGGGRAAFT